MKSPRSAEAKRGVTFAVDVDDQEHVIAVPLRWRSIPSIRVQGFCSRRSPALTTRRL